MDDRKIKFRFLVLLFSSGVLLNFVGFAETLDCYNCGNIANTSDCHTVAVCSANQICHTNTTGSGNNVRFNLGCKPQEDCSAGHQLLGVSIVGRSATSASVPSITDCSQCCGVDICNKHLCTAVHDVCKWLCSTYRTHVSLFWKLNNGPTEMYAFFKAWFTDSAAPNSADFETK